jgi:hypothetical protein
MAGEMVHAKEHSIPVWVESNVDGDQQQEIAPLLAHTAFSFSTASPEQTIAFIGGAIVHVAFFIWVAYLAFR